MTTPDPEQITAYLTARGWRSPAASSTGRWTSPDGRAINFRGEAPEDEADYHSLLRSIAAAEDRSTLAIALAIEGHTVPDGREDDLAAIGAVIAVWRLAAEHPTSFQRLTRGLDIGLETVATDDRGRLLAGLHDSLEALRDLIGAPSLPATLPATDTRPRRQVWAADPAARERIAPWPEPIHQQLLDAFVREETRALNTLLDNDLVTSAEDLTTWRWDPEQAAAVHHTGDLRFQPVPDIDQALTEVRDFVLDDWGRTEGRIVSAWVDHQLKVLAEQGWETSRSLPYDESDIRHQIHHDPGEKRIIVYTPSFHLPDGQPHDLEPAERAMYLRLTADLTELAAADPATQAFPTTASTGPGHTPDRSAVAEPETAGETGPVR